MQKAQFSDSESSASSFF